MALAEYHNVFLHVPGCTESRADLYELDAARTAVRSLPGLEPPEFLDVRRQQRVDRRIARPGRVAAAIAGVAAVVVLSSGIGRSADDAVSAVDLDSFAARHAARASVEPGFQVIPAVSARSVAP